MKHRYIVGKKKFRSTDSSLLTLIFGNLRTCKASRMPPGIPAIRVGLLTGFATAVHCSTSTTAVSFPRFQLLSAWPDSP